MGLRQKAPGWLKKAVYHVIASLSLDTTEDAEDQINLPPARPHSVQSNVSLSNRDSSDWIEINSEAELTSKEREFADLRETREVVLTDRILLREKRNKLKIITNEASDQRVKLINAIRDFFEKNTQLEDIELRESYQRVLAAQDAYGILETDYFEALEEYNEREELFNGKEWIANNGKLGYLVPSHASPSSQRRSKTWPKSVLEDRVESPFVPLSPSSQLLPLPISPIPPPPPPPPPSTPLRRSETWSKSVLEDRVKSPFVPLSPSSQLLPPPPPPPPLPPLPLPPQQRRDDTGANEVSESRYEYLQLVGKVDALQERLLGLLMERADQETIEPAYFSTRRADPEDVKQVEEFLANTQEELREAKLDLEEARRLFRGEASLDGPNTDPNIHGIYLDGSQAPGSPPPGYSFDNEQSGEIHSGNENKDFETNASRGDDKIAKRVNDWIVDGLDKSSLEQARLRAYFRKHIQEGEDWEIIVLRYLEKRSPTQLEEPEATIIRKTMLDSQPSLEKLVKRVEPSYIETTENATCFDSVEPGQEDIQPYYESVLDLNPSIFNVYRALAEEKLLASLAGNMSFIGCWVQ